MTLKHVLKHFNKTEVQEDRELVIHNEKTRNMSLRGAKRRGNLLNKLDCFAYARNDGEFVIQRTKSEESQNQEILRYAQDDGAPYPLPQGAREQLSCAEHTEKNLFSYLPIHLFTFKKAAFTLAEVLITLGIIGVVAAITVPTLISKYQDKVCAKKLINTYSRVLEGFRLMINEYGTIDSWGVNNDWQERRRLIATRLPMFMKVSPCLYGNCFSGLQYKTYDGKKGIVLTTGKQLSMVNGVTMVIQTAHWESCIQNMAMNQKGLNEFGNSNSSIFYGTYQHGCGIIYVDLNGKSGPNKADYDLFRFEIVTDGIIPAGNRKEVVTPYRFDSACLNPSSSYGGMCTAWVMENKNRDYLRCKDLSWNGKSKCK